MWHRIINFNQKAWLKSQVNMNTDLINKAKNDFEKDFLKLMNNAVLRNLQKLSENIGTLNLQQQKKKKLFGIKTKLSHKFFFWKSISSLLWFINMRIK